MEQLCEKYSEVFTDGLGHVKGIQATVHVADNAVPKFCKARPVPYALREAVDKHLVELEEQGVITPIEYSDWASPIVCLPKKSGNVRICGDYKVGLNEWVQVDQYPLPKTQDLFATLAGGRRYTKLDLTQAYAQIEIEPESRKYLTINTQKGLYQMNRLPYGVSSAPAIFQRIMDQVLQGLPGTVCFLDDILISGRDTEEHMQNVEAVLQRLQERGFKVNREKCAFLQSSVTYLGHRIDEQGLHPVQEKTDAIANAPVPKNTTELRAYLALLTYYGRESLHHYQAYDRAPTERQKVGVVRTVPAGV